MAEICLLGKPMERVKASAEFIDGKPDKEAFEDWRFLLFRFEDFATLVAYKSAKSLANEIHDAGVSYRRKYDITDNESDTMIRDVMNSFNIEWHFLRYAEINIY